VAVNPEDFFAFVRKLAPGEHIRLLHSLAPRERVRMLGAVPEGNVGNLLSEDRALTVFQEVLSGRLCINLVRSRGAA
jgi:hypothetical protein